MRFWCGMEHQDLLLLCWSRTKMTPGLMFPPGSPGRRGKREGKAGVRLSQTATSLRRLPVRPKPILLSGSGPSFRKPRARVKRGRRKARESRDGHFGDGPPLMRWNLYLGEKDWSGKRTRRPRHPVPGPEVRAQSRLGLGSASSVLWPRRRRAGCWEGDTQRAMRSRGTRGGRSSSAPPPEGGEAPPRPNPALV